MGERPSNPSEESAELSEQEVFGRCPECGLDKGRNVYAHLFRKHAYSKEKVEELKKQRRISKALSTANEIYPCEECGEPFRAKKTLSQHVKRSHKGEGEEAVTSSLYCPVCEEQMRNHWELIKHVNEEHALHRQCIVEAAEFSGRKNFEEWKNRLEREAVTRFSVVSRKRLPAGSVSYMRCSRARPFPGYANIDRPGSKKIHNCTAFMKVTENGDNFKVKFCSTHCGHEAEPALLRMDPTSEQFIVSLLKEGFRPQQILKKIRKEYRESDRHLRIYYTSYSDIRSIAIRRKIDPWRRDDVDTTSVELRVQENVEDDGIRLYTPATEESGEGFVLVIITPLQKAWLAKYGHRAICVDDTFNLTPYCLRLATIVVLDEWDRGLPAAYLLSNRMSEDEVASMFNELKRLLPDFDTEYFMSDDTNSFYNGFVKTFPHSKARKLLCSFHVLQAIKRNCTAKLKQKTKTESILATVRKLCRTTNPNDFASQYSSLITFLNDQGEKDMAEYFERIWSPRVQQWGGFARRESCVRTSMLIERFHRKLKHEVSNKTNMRIDALMDILITIVPDIEEERAIKMARGLREGRYRLTQQHRAHALAVKLFGCSQGEIQVVEEGLWTVRDRRGLHYVEQQPCLCDHKINNHCNRCKACGYGFLCDCVQDSRAGISCAHVHAALLYAPEGLLKEEEEITSTLGTDLTSTRDNNDETCVLEDPEERAPVEEDPEERAPVEEDPEERAPVDILDNNRELLQELDSVYAALHSKITSLSKVPEKGAQEHIEKVIGILKDMDAETSAKLLLHRTSHRSRPQLARRAELPSRGRPRSHAPIRLSKRAALKSTRTRQESCPVEERDPDEIMCCIICFRRIPDDHSERDEDEWLKCSECGFWAHNACTGEGTRCPYDDGEFKCALPEA